MKFQHYRNVLLFVWTKEHESKQIPVFDREGQLQTFAKGRSSDESPIILPVRPAEH